MSFAHVTLATRDVERTAAFLVAAFGWTRLQHPGNVACDAAWLAVDEAHELHLLRVDDFLVSPFEAEFGRHIAFYHRRDDFDALRSRLRALGVPIIAAIRPTPFERFFFADPVNGYMFEIIEAGAPREAAPGDARIQVR
jgi:catechol 2,3-dioxygenase-like lactoylglutathione lyase family enzyme